MIRKLGSNKKIILLPILIISLFGFLLLIKSNSTTHPRIQNCNYFIGGLNNNLKNIGISNFNQNPNNLSRIVWKRNTEEPFVVYLTQLSESTKTLLLNDQDTNIVDKSIVDLGFNKNPLNTIKIGERNVNGYLKNLVVITTDIDLSSKSMNISCGIKDEKYDNLYNDLLKSTIVMNVLKKSYGQNGLPNIIFSINSIHKNNIIETNISSYDWLGGHSAWFYKDTNMWKEIYEGQDIPSCSILEKYKIESGVSCLDNLGKNNSTK